MDRIDAMQAFVAVADLEGFAPAARKLKLSPSAVTRLVAALEDRLGARLLQRTTRSVTLTDAGTRYLERARRILADVEEAERAAESERTRPSGRLVVSAPLGFGRLHVSPVMTAYLKRYGDVSGELRLEDRMVSLVEDGVDLSVRIGELAGFLAGGAPGRRDAADRGGVAGLSEGARRAEESGGHRLARHHPVRQHGGDSPTGALSRTATKSASATRRGFPPIAPTRRSNMRKPAAGSRG